MPQSETICACGKEFVLFRYYKAHLLKHKCLPKQTLNPPPNPNPPGNQHAPTLENTNTNSVSKPNQVQETTTQDIAQIPVGVIAYKSSHPNILPKENCQFCNKLYSQHNIKTHKLKCKDKYKECSEYKLLVRAGIEDIPETYIEVMVLFNKLMEENPRIFTNLPPDRTAFEEFEKGLPQRGRPRKNTLTVQPTNTINHNRNQFRKHTTINNITNNNNNITNNVQNVQNNNNITQNNNINVFINPVYHESLAHITPERRLYIILQRLNAFKALIDSIYEEPANNNIYISDRKGEQVKFRDLEHGINNGSSDDIIGNVAMSHLGHLDNLIETHKDEVPEHRKNDLEFIKAYTLDETNNTTLIKEMLNKVDAMHQSAKMLLDKYEKTKMEEFLAANILNQQEQLLTAEIDNLEPQLTCDVLG